MKKGKLMKRRKILVLIPMLGLFLTGCTFQEGFVTAKHWVGQNIYHPVKDFFEGLIGKKDNKEEEQTPSGEEGGGEETVKTLESVAFKSGPETVKVNTQLDPALVKLTATYSDKTTEEVSAEKVTLNTSVVAENVKGVAEYKTKTAEFTINVVEDSKPVVEEITPEQAIALCDQAGEGVVVQPLVRVKGVVDSGSSLGNNGWGGKFVADGNKQLSFDSAQTEETYKTLDGATVVIEGYPELYNGAYKLGYLPASASPTEAKFNPTLVSVELPAAKEVKTIDSVEGPTEVLVGTKISINDVTLHVTYSDGTTGTEVPDTVALNTDVESEGATLTATLGSLSGTCTVKVVAVKEFYTPAEAIALCDKAGSGVVVEPEINVKGVVASGSSLGTNGWSGKFVEKSGDKEFVFESVKASETYESLDGATVTIKGYAELYNGKYKLGYLPASASPTQAKYNPSLVSVELPGQKTIKGLIENSAEGIPESVVQHGSLSKTSITVGVTYDDESTGTVHPDSIELDTETVKDGVTGKLIVGEFEYSFTINVVAEKEFYTPAEAIALCDEAGSGVVVQPEINVKGVVASGSSLGTNGWSGKFVEKSGDKEFVFESVTASETYESLDGATVTIKGYAELYNGKYKLGYLPASASPTQAKYNPSFVSVELPAPKTIASLVANSAEGIPASISQHGTLDKTSITVGVAYDDESTGTVHPDSIELDTETVKDGVTGKLIVGEFEYSFTINVVAASAELTAKHTSTEIATLYNWTTSVQGAVVCYKEFDLDSNITISTTGDDDCGSFWGSDWRLYQAKSGNVVITAKEGYELVSVKLTFGNKNSGVLKDGETTVSSATVVNLSGSSKTFTVGNSGTATNGQIKITAFEVVYRQA